MLIDNLRCFSSTFILHIMRQVLSTAICMKISFAVQIAINSLILIHNKEAEALQHLLKCKKAMKQSISVCAKEESSNHAFSL